MTTRRRSVALARHGTATRRHKLANEDNESTDEMKLRNGMQDAEKCNEYANGYWDWDWDWVLWRIAAKK